MNKLNKLILFGLILTSCTNISNIVDPNTTPSTSVSSSPVIETTPTINTSNTPSVLPSPNANSIKKVELYDQYNRLVQSEDFQLTMVNSRYYDFKTFAKITYINDTKEDKEIFLESSNKDIAHIRDGVLYIHSKDNSSTFNLNIFDKNTSKQIASYKIRLEESTGGLDVKEIVTIHGEIYDKDGSIIKNASITFKYIDPQFEGFDKYPIITQPISGDFKIDYVRAGGRIELTVSKEGYKTVTRKLVSKGNLIGADTNLFNFGGTNEDDKPYALERL